MKQWKSKINHCSWMVYTVFHAMEYYIAMKKGKSLSHRIWVALKSIMLGDRSLTQKNIYCLPPFI